MTTDIFGSYAKPVTWTPPPRPDWVDRLNAQGEGLGDRGRSLVALDDATLLAAARAATGLDDFGDGGFREPLAILCRALEGEADLTLLGRIFARAEIQRPLEARLRVEDWFRRHPETRGSPIEQPIFVTGLGRSGTTFLHELLWQDPSNRAPLLWETMHPVPPPEGDATDEPRIALAHREITLMDEIDPSFSTMHENGGDLPTECIFVFALEMATDMFVGEFDVPSYAAWLGTCDDRPAYAAHRRLLQLLQARRPTERWVLKAPSHLSRLRALFHVYPDARVVITHRDPLRVLGSLTHLMAALRWMRSDRVAYEELAAMMSMGFGFLLERLVAWREAGKVPAEQIADVGYAELVADPLRTVAALYERWGIPFSGEVQARIRAYLARKHEAPRSRHDYSLAATGLDATVERARFACYQERYAVPSEV